MAGMQLTVGTAAVPVPYDSDSRLSLQNLGPGILYIDTQATVTAATGVQIAVGGGYESPVVGDRGGKFYLISDTANTDVRYMEV